MIGELGTRRSRSSRTIRPSTQSRSKVVDQSIKSEASHGRSTIPKRVQLYVPLKENLRKGKSEKSFETQISPLLLELLSGNNNGKGLWEAQIVSQKDKGQSRARSQSEDHTTHWAKFEDSQNTRNRLDSNIYRNEADWNAPNIWNTEREINFKRQNLRMAYQREFFKDLKNLDLRPFILDSLEKQVVGDSLIPESQHTPSPTSVWPLDKKSRNLTEKARPLSPDLKRCSWKPILKKKTKHASSSCTSKSHSTPKSVSFAAGTVFFERNLNSYFWCDITMRQQLRKLERKRRSVANSSMNRQSSEPRILRKRKTQGFWRGVRELFGVCLGPSRNRL